MSAVGDDFYQEVMGGIGAGWSENIARLCRDWQAHEGGSATWNPWNTTQPMHAATDYNSVHVKNYPDRETGIRATVRTLTNGHYPAIVEALVNDLPESEWGAEEAILAQLGVWGTANWAAELRRKAGHQSSPAPPSPHPQPHHDGMLRVGSHGAEVQRWQSELNLVDGAGLAEDGIFGPITEHATVTFQHKHGLLTDGIVGPRTQGAMDSILAVSGQPGSADQGTGAAGTAGGAEFYPPGYAYDQAGYADQESTATGYTPAEAPDQPEDSVW